eukprot:CAMPEP_0172572792 /NCGR_PEP_ID=MMETSP1067-20121228/135860_1 /TAXON_ID=265564 ORGANISM="Thalassiosira punctigera, Strain Tpunct2005C2" /NCGR_SAMPLE_ID=MMETSP1067 /ASSEMBLY_ACC=CAM_ASM_000444 /LENGTH=404 /DNA_ID=CAMNT_0013365379 /DNA_START=126 /DNA_END=1340 /DNA_ORIENTATION=-
MMLFDKNPSGESNIVIVPPKPDFAFQTEDEFSYSNLFYCADDATPRGGEGGGSGPTTTTTAFPAPSPADVVAAAPAPEGGTLRDNPGNSAAASRPSSLSSGDAAAADGNFAPSAFERIDGGDAGRTRDPRNGAFTFQVHAEYDLLLHVQKDLDKHRDENSTDVELSEIITRSVDEYCLRKQWMYHIGCEKGSAIKRFLREGAEGFVGSEEGAEGGVKKFVCVDMGTYCGYSALVLASTLRQFVRDSKQPFEFHIYTTEVSSKLINVAQSFFRLAKMDAHITTILVKGEEDNKDEGKKRQMLSEILLKEHGVNRIDFLLLDHAKHLYLEDLQDLENAGLLQKGSRVSADNVVFNRLDAYRDHVHKLVEKGAATSRLEEMNLEYSNNLKDGVEMTVYLKDPLIPTK